MNIASSVSKALSFPQCLNSNKVEDMIGEVESSDDFGHSYFSICAPLPGMPSGNRFPYGICGPFLDEQEAYDALAALKSKHPDRPPLVIVRCRDFSDLPINCLIRDQERARAKLSTLLATR